MPYSYYSKTSKSLKSYHSAWNRCKNIKRGDFGGAGASI